MTDLVVKAAYATVATEDGQVFVGFVDARDESYALFRKPVGGGAIWFEVNDEGFGAEEAVDRVTAGPKGLEITLKQDMAAKFGWATSVAVRIGPGTEDASEALEALAQMLGARWQG